MGWNVKYNHLAAVAVAMHGGINGEVDDAANAMALQLKGTLWIDTGMVRRVTEGRNLGPGHAEVAVGWNRGHGFYSRFNEWGTRKQAARPIVGPTAHAFEPVFLREMEQTVRDACEAK